MGSANKNSLFYRSGERKGIRAIRNTALETHISNPSVKHRFSTLSETRQYLIVFLIRRSDNRKLAAQTIKHLLTKTTPS